MRLQAYFLLSFVCNLIVSTSTWAQQVGALPDSLFQNPILPGFNPDPSICRVGEDYYLVTSTFAYYPGIPVYHSRNLTDWNIVGHVINRPTQADLKGVKPSDGIYAATIRYHLGTYYVVTSLVVRSPRRIRNVLYTATNPAGPWSEPIVLTDSTNWSIDPSLFFDDDGKAYFTANRIAPGGQPYPGHREIAIQELDLKTHKLVGKIAMINDGAMKGAVTAEGPHIYKKDGYYYLLISEGGTGTNHAVAMSRSKAIFGPYENYAANPILTHRHLGPSAPIQCTGHADLVETQNGDWWLVALGTRAPKGITTLGRETFLCPVTWPHGQYPIVNPGIGQIRLLEKRPAVPRTNLKTMIWKDEFEQSKLALEWNFVRMPQKDFYSLAKHKGYLRLSLLPEQITELVSPAFIGRRIQHHSFTATVKLDFTPKAETEEAGLVLLENHANHYRFVLSKASQQTILKLVARQKGVDSVLAQMPVQMAKGIFLQVKANNQQYSFYQSNDNINWKPIYENASPKPIQTSQFTGAYIGLYATAKGQESKNYLDVDWFVYEP